MRAAGAAGITTKTDGVSLLRLLGLSGIYAIVDTQSTNDPIELTRAALDGGIRIVQYRAKEGVDRDVMGAMQSLVRAAGGALIVNDDVEAAMEADGVHLGQEDAAVLDVRSLRSRLGSRVLGLSTGSPAEARAAQAAGADYVGIGPMFATSTKLDAGPAIGSDGVRAVVESVTIPVVAIGGIELAKLAEVRATGAAMAAVISALAKAPDPAAAARALHDGWTAGAART